MQIFKEKKEYAANTLLVIRLSPADKLSESQITTDLL